MSIAVESEIAIEFVSLYYILNILLCILPDDGGWQPKH
jgi:hypothetical protein